MIQLAVPFWLLLIGVGVVAAMVWTLRRRWLRYPFPLEARVDSKRSRRLGWTAIAGVLAASTFAPLAVALARPQEVLSRLLEHAEGVDMVVALDISSTRSRCERFPTAPPLGSGWEPQSTASGPRRRSPRSSSS
jgi:hypothetical protein